MKVSLRVTVELDPASWTMAYGVEGAAEIREDVRRYIRAQIDYSAAAEEAGLQVVAIA